ncbi:hypothetical protein BX616_004193 [Lobosporangium transversale]|uniref:TFIIB-type domain-containing protein n=1 Tax=Lobosporangium transversale TaxID=64571 RepID=A0A1Y2GK82_9FUNG|nr:hypothetical protein BCR41DRAFT_355441 [Lobosporangium transversale]KAF9918921.1 hypothetical protein BX616_004193 [Lobosporangium transversale]ORZ13325.1 hypothetical protein BCR41DRAFT_355441 [Lobosporangium transversale]|eukprot:XP_021880406.1 hypothetical protein BCR41DRAFT_355441 [Lobosporangium transversale]
MDHRKDLQCPQCQSTEAYEEHATGETVCHVCGHVFEDGIIYTELSTTDTSGEPQKQPYSQGTVRVNRTGQTYGFLSDSAQHHLGGYGYGSFTQDRRRLYRAKRYAQIKTYLSFVTRQCELSEAHINRAFFLWKQVMALMQLKFWTRAAQGALACLYLAVKEAKKGISLVEIAVKAEESPYKVGALYKAIKGILLENSILEAGNACFNLENDPWLMLQRIMSIGTTDSIQRGDMENLSQEFQDVLGVHRKPEMKRACLRTLLAAAQKCMTIATDSGLATGRPIPALVAACLIIAIEVRLMAPKCPEELFHFAAMLFSTSHFAVMARYKEVRQCMLIWARRLPFVDKTDKIKDAKLVFYMEDVLKYFGHLQEQNKRVWAALDHQEGSEERDDDEDRVGPGENFIAEDLRLEQQDNSLWTLDDEDMDGDKGVPSLSLNNGQLRAATERPAEAPLQHNSTLLTEAAMLRALPPAFVSSVERRNKRMQEIHAAKLLVSRASLTSFSSLSSPPLSSISPHGDQKSTQDLPSRRNRFQERLKKQRIEWIQLLLEHGSRTEQELLEATDNTLAYWVSSISNRNYNPPRTHEQLNSEQLTSEDLDEAEFEQYLRPRSDASAVLRVMSNIYDEAEKAKQRGIMRQEGKEARSKRREFQRQQQQQRQCQQVQLGIKATGKRKFIPLPPSKKRLRSWKINLEALSDQEDVDGDSSRTRRKDKEYESIGGKIDEEGKGGKEQDQDLKNDLKEKIFEHDDGDRFSEEHCDYDACDDYQDYEEYD